MSPWQDAVRYRAGDERGTELFFELDDFVYHSSFAALAADEIVGAWSPEPESRLELPLLTRDRRALLERLTRKRAAPGSLTPALVASNISDDAQTRPGTSPFPAHVCCLTKLGDAPTRLPSAAGVPPGRARWHFVPEAAFEIFQRKNRPTMTGWSSDEVRSDLRLRW